MHQKHQLLLGTHLGCGDALVCNGLVRYLCERKDLVVVVVKRRYINSVRFMFRDILNVAVYPVTNDMSEVSFPKFTQLGFEILLLGDNSGKQWHTDDDWVSDLYKQAGVCPSISRTKFQVERDTHSEQALYETMVPSKSPYVFVHDDPDRGYLIPAHIIKQFSSKGSVIIRPGLLGKGASSSCLFDYCLVIQLATAFITIDSSFAWLHEFLDLNENSVMCTSVKSGMDRCMAVFKGRWTFV